MKCFQKDIPNLLLTYYTQDYKLRIYMACVGEEYDVVSKLFLSMKLIQSNTEELQNQMA
jgi:hypothetical protein